MAKISTIQFYRGKAAAWTSANHILEEGEPGFETDTNKMKIGDGSTAWNSLAYIAGGGSSDVDAVDVDFTPSGNISSTNVQAAIEELDSEKQAALGFTPENTANKATDLNSPDNTKFPTTQAVANAISAAIDGLKWKEPVRVIAIADISLSGAPSIDGITVVNGDRVLAAGQTTAIQNGIYIVAAGAWSRSSDANTGAELEGASVTVKEGTTNGNTSWTQTTDGVTIGSSNIVWSQLGSAVPNASQSVAGKVEIATASEAKSGTTTGSSGAELVIRPDVLNDTIFSILDEPTNSRAISIDDRNRKITFTHASANGFTLSGSLPSGFVFYVEKATGAGNITPTGYTTIVPNPAVISQENKSVAFVHQGANVWKVYGAIGSDVTEVTTNKATSFSTINNTLYPTVQAVNNQFSSLVGQGLLSARPSASSANIGYLYFATDTKALYRSNGTTWDVWSINSAVINVKDYGVVGDGVTNDGPALNTLIGTLSNDATLFFPTGTYLINTNVAINKRLYVTGQFPVLTTTANISIMTVTVAESKFSNLIFVGQGKATAGRTAQFGLNINGVGRTMTTNCTFKDFPGGGFFYTNTYVSPGAIAGVIGNCTLYSNKIGIASGSRGEYFAITGCTSNSNDTGMSMAGGNNLISNCNFNYDGTGLEIISGTNNAHGIISNSNFNHCTTYGINAHDFSVGQTFSNIHMYESPLRIASCTGAKFSGGTLDCDTYTFSNATSLTFENTTFGTGYSPSISLSGTNSIAYLNCKHLDGRMAIDAATFTNTYASNFVAGTVQTTDATPLNTILSALLANTAGKWRLEVVGKITSATNINDMLAADMIAATKMTGAGTGALEGSVTNIYTQIKSASMASATATMDVNSDNLRAVFTGLASTTIKWDYKLNPMVN